MKTDADDLIDKLLVLVRNEEWELLDAILDGLEIESLDDTDIASGKRAMLIGMHVGFLKGTMMRERSSFKHLLMRFRTALEASPSFKATGLSSESVIHEILGGVAAKAPVRPS